MAMRPQHDKHQGDQAPDGIHERQRHTDANFVLRRTPVLVTRVRQLLKGVGHPPHHKQPTLPPIKRAYRDRSESTQTPGGKNHQWQHRMRLLELRNTPEATGQSPAQLIYGRPHRSTIIAHPLTLYPAEQVQWLDVQQQHKATRAKSTARYNQHTKELPPLPAGCRVRVQNPTTKQWDLHAKVVNRKGPRWCYFIETTSGNTYWRNRRFLRPM